jgi:hypothetical protein
METFFHHLSSVGIVVGVGFLVVFFVAIMHGSSKKKMDKIVAEGYAAADRECKRVERLSYISSESSEVRIWKAVRGAVCRFILSEWKLTPLCGTTDSLKNDAKKISINIFHPQDGRLTVTYFADQIIALSEMCYKIAKNNSTRYHHIDGRIALLKKIMRPGYEKLLVHPWFQHKVS